MFSFHLGGSTGGKKKIGESKDFFFFFFVFTLAETCEPHTFPLVQRNQRTKRYSPSSGTNFIFCSHSHLFSPPISMVPEPIRGHCLISSARSRSSMRPVPWTLSLLRKTLKSFQQPVSTWAYSVSSTRIPCVSSPCSRCIWYGMSYYTKAKRASPSAE